MDNSDVKTKVIIRYIIQFLLIEYALFNLSALVLCYLLPSKIEVLVHLAILSGVGAISAYYYFKGSFLREVDEYINSKHQEDYRDCEVAKHHLRSKGMLVTPSVDAHREIDYDHT